MAHLLDWHYLVSPLRGIGYNVEVHIQAMRLRERGPVLLVLSPQRAVEFEMMLA